MAYTRTTMAIAILMFAGLAPSPVTAEDRELDEVSAAIVATLVGLSAAVAQWAQENATDDPSGLPGGHGINHPCREPDPPGVCGYFNWTTLDDPIGYAQDVTSGRQASVCDIVDFPTAPCIYDMICISFVPYSVDLYEFDVSSHTYGVGVPAYGRSDSSGRLVQGSLQIRVSLTHNLSCTGAPWLHNLLGDVI
jgi:hypothetical protein